LNGLGGLNEVSTWLSSIGHSLLTSQQLFTDEAVMFVSYTLSLAVSQLRQQRAQSPHLSQLLYTVEALSSKYTTVSLVTVFCYDVNNAHC